MSASNDGPICFGESATLTAGTVTGATYTWRLGNAGGTVVGTDRVFVAIRRDAGLPPHRQRQQLRRPDHHDHRWRECGPGGNAQHAYTLNGDCSATDLYSRPTTARTPATLTATFAWNGPNGFTSASAHPVITDATAADNGTYSLVYTDANGCSTGLDRGDHIVTANLSPRSPPAVRPARTAPSRSASPAYGGSAVSYVWSFDDNGFATAGGSTTLVNASGQGTSPLVLTPVAAATAGDYRVDVIVDGCALERSATAVVFPEPAATPRSRWRTPATGALSSLRRHRRSNSRPTPGPARMASRALTDPIIFPATAATTAHTG